ncbi:MAG: DUF2867 domain-containing protein [Jatrophihabitantaceae bacterium]
MSVVYERMPRPDWAMTTTTAVPGVPARTPRAWAEAIFDQRSVPIWVKALYGVREVAVRVLGLAPGEASMLAVRDVVGDEAIIDTDDRHLHFVAGVRADAGLLHVTTAVQLKGWRGHLYFVPVRFLHDQITRSMMQAAALRVEAGSCDI